MLTESAVDILSQRVFLLFAEQVRQQLAGDDSVAGRQILIDMFGGIMEDGSEQSRVDFGADLFGSGEAGYIFIIELQRTVHVAVQSRRGNQGPRIHPLVVDALQTLHDFRGLADENLFASQWGLRGFEFDPFDVVAPFDEELEHEARHFSTVQTVASVYAMNPQIYLLDEPSSNLDMTSIQELRDHLRLIKKQGKTVLIAEHRLYYLMELADRIVYLEKGEIKGIYTSEEFRQLSEHEREHMGLRAVDLQAVFPPKAHLPAPTPVLELRNVTLRYKKQTILHDIVLSAGKGEVIGVVGHNGAGKTTFSRALCGLHKDCDGQFLWESKPIERKERLQRSYMVMQDVNYELFADSVEAECSFGIRNPDQTLVNATLEELGLSPYREQHPNTLSGGQKQRVAVAVSMICGKDLLVFDEPTSGLDFDSMTQVAGLIRRLSNMGKVIFIVTHDFEFVCRTCSRVLHFDEGEIPDDVLVTMDALPKLRELFSVKVNVPAGDREGGLGRSDGKAR